ncbi:AAA family ATPase [Brevibacterium salitolerans]|uniref:HTH luxR-type domain-containing protein n=1 Tax=Brevibacterium salitolerans TaxID=1403566 RepID=A0ABP5HY72_9MICO
MILGEEIELARDALRAGWSVRITGSRGSGRSRVAREAADALERSGAPVLRCRGEHSTADSPGSVLRQLAAELGLRPRGADGRSPAGQGAEDLAGALDQVTQGLTASMLLVVDDPHRMDPVSLRALATLRERTGARTVMSEVTGASAAERLPLHWPERVVTVRPLDLPAAGALAHAVLGAPLSPAVLTRVLTKTGGSPLLLTALLQSARHRGLLQVYEGMWTQSGFALWNDDMAPVIDEILTGEGPQGVALLGDLALEPARSEAELVRAHGEGTLRGLRERGLVRSTAAQGSPGLVVWPPLLAERFNRERIPALTVEEPVSDVPDWCGSADRLAALAARFVESSLAQAGRALAAWRADPTVEHALAYCAAASGDPRQQDDLERVLADTPTAGRPADAALFRLAYARAQWTAIRHHDPESALSSLREFGHAHAPWRESAESASTLIDLFTGRGVPADLDGVLRPGPDPTGVREAAALVALLAAGRIGRARREADARPGAERAVTDWARQVLPLFEGDFLSALRIAAQEMRRGERELDRVAFVSAGYTAVLAHHSLGRYRAVQECVDAMVMVGRPQVDYTSMYAAALNVQGLIAVFGGQPEARDSFLSEAAVLMPQPGPFLGMGTDSFQPLLDLRSPAAVSDGAAAETVRRRRRLGYLAGAAQTGAALLTLAYGRETTEELRTVLREADLPAYRTAGELTALIDAGAGVSRLAELLGTGAGRQDGALLRSLLRSAARRIRADGEPHRADELESVARTAFDSAAGPDLDPLELDLPARGTQVLTAREREIALLAGSLGNREIAERLSLSVRTVENHLARAGRKLGSPGRGELARLAERTA